MTTSIAAVIAGCAVALCLMFINISVKRKPYIIARNCLLAVAESIFFLSLLIGAEELKAPGAATYFQIVFQKGVWWTWPLRVIVPLFLAFITVLATQLEGKSYDVFCSLLLAPALFLGLHLTNSLSSTGLILGFVYTCATVIVGLLFFKYYICLEIAFVSGFIISYLISSFYYLSSITMWFICLCITVFATSMNLTMLSKEKEKEEQKKLKQEQRKMRGKKKYAK